MRVSTNDLLDIEDRLHETTGLPTKVFIETTESGLRFIARMYVHDEIMQATREYHHPARESTKMIGAHLAQTLRAQL